MQKGRPESVVICVKEDLWKTNKETKTRAKSRFPSEAELSETNLGWEEAEAAADRQPQPPIIRAKTVI